MRLLSSQHKGGNPGDVRVRSGQCGQAAPGFIQTHRVAAGGRQDRTVPPPNPFEKAKLSKCENVG